MHICLRPNSSYSLKGLQRNHVKFGRRHTGRLLGFNHECENVFLQLRIGQIPRNVVNMVRHQSRLLGNLLGVPAKQKKLQDGAWQVGNRFERILIPSEHLVCKTNSFGSIFRKRGRQINVQTATIVSSYSTTQTKIELVRNCAIKKKLKPSSNCSINLKIKPCKTINAQQGML